MVLLQSITGEQKLATSSCKMFIFFSPQPKNRGMMEQHLSAVAKATENAQLVRKVGVAENTPAVSGVKSVIGGEWTKQGYEIGEGEFVKIFYSKKAQWNKFPVTSCLFLRMRATAPYQKISIPTLLSPSSSKKFLEIMGRFDIVSLQDALDAGVTVNPAYRHLFNEPHTKREWTVTELEPQLAAAPVETTKVIQTAGGKQRVIPTRDVTRVIEM